MSYIKAGDVLQKNFLTKFRIILTENTYMCPAKRQTEKAGGRIPIENRKRF